MTEPQLIETHISDLILDPYTALPIELTLILLKQGRFKFIKNGFIISQPLIRNGIFVTREKSLKLSLI